MVEGTPRSRQEAARGDTARAATSDKVKCLLKEARDLKEVLADITLENRLLKKAWSGMGEMKNEISRTGEARNHPAYRTAPFAGQDDTRKLGIPRPIFYRWHGRFVTHDGAGLEDRTSAPSRVWNRIPDDIRERIIAMALDHADLSLRELAVKFTDTKSCFVSEASVYRLLKAHDLITSPAFIVFKADNEFKDKTARPNEMWLQTPPI